MKIAFDCSASQPVKGMKYNGGGEYTLSVLSELLKSVDFQIDEIILLKNKQKGENDQLQKFILEYALSFFCYSTLDELSEYCSRFEGDLIFFPVCYPAYAVLHIKNGIRVVGGIHDMSSYYSASLGNQPGRYYRKNVLEPIRCIVHFLVKPYRMKKSLKQHKKLFHLNDHTEIYSVSYYTKSDLQSFFPTEQVAKVFYSPHKIVSKINEDKEENIFSGFGITSHKYILLSNLSRWHKNNIRVIRVLTQLFFNGMLPKDYRVVLVGCIDEQKKYIRRQIKNAESHFVMLGFIPSQALEILYKNAYIYIYASLLEGFGSPPVEAMRYGTVSVCSTSTSIPEICGDAVIYFNPLEMSSIQRAILRAFDPEYYKMIKGKISRRYQELTDKQSEDLNSLIEFLKGI